MGIAGNKMQKLEPRRNSIDRLSLLPDFILTDILSCLPLRSAVATSVLSQRWRYLWTQITHLFFDCYDCTRNLGLEAYIATVNRLLPQFTSPKIHSFRLVMPPVNYIIDKSQQTNGSSFESWIATVCNRHVDRIEVNITGWFWRMTSISAAFRCHCLEALALHGDFRVDGDIVTSLPNLKQLDFDLYILNVHFLDKLLKYCPRLERLSLEGEFLFGYRHPLDLSNLSLKTFCIKIHKNQNVPSLEKLVINASKLKDITLHGLCLDCLCFIKRSGALVTADMSLKPGDMDTVSDTKTAEFAELISSVTTLRLNSTAFKVLNKPNSVNFPVFNNLSNVKIESEDIDGNWNDMLRFLSCSPMLESLTLKLSGNNKPALDVPNYNPPPCGLLKTIYIEGIKGQTADYKMMKYIMSNAKVLELLSLRVSVPFQRRDSILWNEYDFCEKLFQLQNNSTCKIEYYGIFLKVSSNGVKNKRPHFERMRLGWHLECFSNACQPS